MTYECHHFFSGDCIHRSVLHYSTSTTWRRSGTRRTSFHLLHSASTNQWPLTDWTWWKCLCSCTYKVSTMLLPIKYVSISSRLNVSFYHFFSFLWVIRRSSIIRWFFPNIITAPSSLYRIQPLDGLVAVELSTSYLILWLYLTQACTSSGWISNVPMLLEPVKCHNNWITNFYKETIKV